MKSAKIVIFGAFLLLLVTLGGFYIFFSRAFTGNGGSKVSIGEIIPTKTLSGTIADIASCKQDDPVLCQFIDRGKDIVRFYSGSFTHRYSLTDKVGMTTVTTMQFDPEGEIHMTESKDNLLTYDVIIVPGVFYERDMSKPAINAQWNEKSLNTEDREYYKNFKKDTITKAVSYANRAEAKYLGNEKCGSLDCNVYEFTASDVPERLDKYYIDTKEYRIRKHTGHDTDGSVFAAEFDYADLKVNKP